MKRDVLNIGGFGSPGMGTGGNVLIIGGFGLPGVGIGGNA